MNSLRKAHLKAALPILLVLLSSSALAGISEFSEVSGRVTDFNEQTVTLLHEGKKFQIPRSAVPSYENLRPGNRVVAYLKTNKLKKLYKETR